jgi:hypothetical protein
VETLVHIIHLELNLESNLYIKRQILGELAGKLHFCQQGKRCENKREIYPERKKTGIPGKHRVN